MALKGDLASVDLAQVFQMLALNQKVGLLAIESPTEERDLYFDERGVTHITDDPAGVPAHALTTEQGFRDLWSSPVGGDPVAGTSLDASEARIQRLIRGAVDDLRRGETARASASLAKSSRPAMAPAEGILIVMPSSPAWARTGSETAPWASASMR